MTLKNFKKYADLRACDYGIDTKHITVIAGIYGCHSSCDIRYSIQAWEIKKGKHINARQSNPMSCLVEFEVELNRYFKEYSQTQIDMEIEED